MIKLVIFDLDGTLLNTLVDLADSGNYVLANHNFPTHPVDAYRYFVGNGIPTLVKRILPEEYREGEMHQQCLDEFLAYYKIHMSDKTHVYPGMPETLKTLQNDGVKIAVATNKVHSAVRPLMEKYFPEVQFDVLCGQYPGMNPKPDPKIVFEILKQIGCEKAETLYAGDTAVDMDTAHNAGLSAVGVLWGYRPKEELEAANANYLINKPMELLELVRKMNGHSTL